MMQNYRIIGSQDHVGRTHWKIKKRFLIFFWKTIYKGSLEACLAELNYYLGFQR